MTDGLEDVSFYLSALDGLLCPPPPAERGIALAAALRDLVSAVVTSTAPPGVLAEVEATVRDLVEELRSGREDGKADPEAPAPAVRYMHHPFYGPANPVAVPMTISFDGGVNALATYGVMSEGREGQVHPGWLAASVLSLMSLTAVSNGRRGRLRSVELSYLSPAPLDTELAYRVEITQRGEAFTRLAATVRCGVLHLVEAVAVVAAAANPRATAPAHPAG